MKRITSRKESRRSSVSKPPSNPRALQYFTYDDVAASAAPKVGDFPQHGDTVALGEAEQEAEVAHSRASKRISQAMEGREHEDIFANAPEEPLAPEEPRRNSRRDSRRSSRRASRRASFEAAGLAPSSSRNSRAISPERGVTNGVSTSNSRRDSTTGQRLSRHTGENPEQVAALSAPIVAKEALAATPAPVATPAPAAASAPVHPPKVKSPSPAARAAAATPPTATGTPVNASGTLSQVPTADDALSRAQTRASSGQPSRQSTRAGDLGKRTSTMTAGSTKSKSKRQSRRSSKPEPLKYFTYDDVSEATPPIFGKVPDPDDLENNERRAKGKDREEGAVGGDPESAEKPEDAPRVPELPQKLAHMDLAGTGLTRSSTRDTASGRQAAKRQEYQRASAPVAGSAGVDKNLTSSHGLDFTDIPDNARGTATRRAPAPPPPVNMSTKPPSKRPSRDLKNGVPVAVGTTAAAAGAAAAVAAGASDSQKDSQPARTSSFHEHLPETLRHGGVSSIATAEDGRAKEAMQETTGHASPEQPKGQSKAPSQPSEPPKAAPSVVERTRQALGAVFLPNQTPTNPPSTNNQETGFVSAPSSPADEKGPFVPPSAAEVITDSKATPAASQPQTRQIREERLTREVHTYDTNKPGKPVITVEVLSRRYFMQTDDGHFIEVLQREVPDNVLAASRQQTTPPPVLPSQEYLSSQNI